VDARRAAALANRRARAAPAGLALFVGRADATAFIVPCILSALTDYEHVVIEHALNVLASLCELALLAKDLMLDVLRRQGMNMVVHPSLGVRAAALSVILAIAKTLSLTEAHTKLLPVLRPFLKSADVVLISEETLLEELRPPVSRAEFDQLIHAPPTQVAFRRHAIPYVRKRLGAPSG
jgi:hypothetical protein